MAQVTLPYTSMEVVHHVAERLRVYRFFENRNKNIKTNKERGEVYNDFDFDSTVLLSECTSILPIRKRWFKTPMMCFSLIWMLWYPICLLIMPCWKQIKTTRLSFTTYSLLIILITIFHQVHQTRST